MTMGIQGSHVYNTPSRKNFASDIEYIEACCEAFGFSKDPDVRDRFVKQVDEGWTREFDLTPVEMVLASNRAIRGDRNE